MIKNKQALSTLRLLQVKERKTDNNRRKKEAEKRTDEKEATKLNQRNFNKEYVIQNDVIQMTGKRMVVPSSAEAYADAALKDSSFFFPSLFHNAADGVTSLPLFCMPHSLPPFLYSVLSTRD